MRKWIAAAGASLSLILLTPLAATAQEQSPPTTSEIDEALPGDAPDALEDNGSGNAGLWGLLGLAGLAGLLGLKRKRDTGVTPPAPRNTAPPTARGASSTDA